MGLNRVVCLLSTVCSDVSTLTLVQPTVPEVWPSLGEGLGVTSWWVFVPTELRLSHPARVFVASSQSCCAHGEFVDVSGSVWPRASENLYFIKCIQGCLAACHRGQPWNCKQPPQPARAEPAIQTRFYKAEALKYRKMMCFNWWKHISSAWDTFFLFYLSTLCSDLCFYRPVWS